jgi:hypothetical protein
VCRPASPRRLKPRAGIARSPLVLQRRVVAARGAISLAIQPQLVVAILVGPRRMNSRAEKARSPPLRTEILARGGGLGAVPAREFIRRVTAGLLVPSELSILINRRGPAGLYPRIGQRLSVDGVSRSRVAAETGLSSNRAICSFYTQQKNPSISGLIPSERRVYCCQARPGSVLQTSGTRLHPRPSTGPDVQPANDQSQAGKEYVEWHARTTRSRSAR